MNSNLSKLLLLATLSTSASYASLPDEINPEPYRIQYQQTLQQVAEIEDKLSRIISEINTNERERSQVVSQINSLEAQNDNLRLRIERNENEIDSLIVRSNELNQKIRNLTTRKSRLTAKIRNLNNQISKEEQRLAPIRDRLIKIEKRLEQKRIVLKREVKNLENARNVVNRVKSQVQKLKSDKQTIKSKIAKHESDLQNLGSSIQKKKVEIQNTKSQLQAQRGTLKKQQDKKAVLLKEQEAIKLELSEVRQNNPRDPKVRELRAKLAAKVKQVNVQNQAIKNTKGKINNLKNTKTKLEGQLATLQNGKVEIPKKIAKLKSDLKTKNTLLQTKKVELQNAQNKRAEIKVAVDTHRADIDKITVRRQNVEARLQTESRNLRTLQNDLNDKRARLNNVVAKLNNAKNENDRVLATVDQLEQEIPGLQRQLNTNSRQITRNQRVVSNIDIALDGLYNNRNTEEANLSRAERRRDISYNDYTTRENRYQEKLSEAKSIGQSEAAIAEDKGLRDGEANVASRSTELGLGYGSKLANVQGEYWGTARSEIQGHEDGYEIGYASNADEARGLKEGKAAGIQAARTFANEVLKPQYFSEILVDSIENQKMFKLVKASPSELGLDKVEDEDNGQKSLESFSSVLPLTNSELQKSISIMTSLDAKIENLGINLENLENTIQDMSKPHNAYVNPSVPFGNAKCLGVYKNVRVLKDACKASYRNEFASLYNNAHYEVFSSNYENMFERKLENARLREIDTTYGTAYDAAYPIAKSKGIADGKVAIYDESYANARAEAYNTELPQASLNARSKAKYEVQNWINSNATLTLMSGAVAQSSIRGGDTANIKLALKNISPVRLKAPIKLVITDTKNVSVAKDTYLLKKAGANSTVSFDDIQIKVNDDVPSKQTASISGQIIYDGGPYGADRVEEFTVEKKTDVNPAVNMEANYKKLPKVLTSIRRKILIHTMTVNLGPKVESLGSGYEATLTAMPGSETLIKFKNTTASTGKLSLGSSKKVKFKYTFKKKSRGKIVNLKLIISYKGEAISTENITIKPQ